MKVSARRSKPMTIPNIGINPFLHVSKVFKHLFSQNFWHVRYYKKTEEFGKYGKSEINHPRKPHDLFPR